MASLPPSEEQRPGSENRFLAGLDTKRNVVLIAIAFFLDALLLLAGPPVEARAGFVGELVVLSPFIGGALLLFRRRIGSGVTLLAVAVLFGFGLFAHGSFSGSFWVLLLAWVFFASEDKRYRLTLVVVFVLWACTVAVFVATTLFGEIIFVSFILLLGLAVAQSERFRLAYENEVAARQLQREAEWKAEVVRVAQEERNTMSRELHDIVAHSVSVMVVQARGARRVPDVPENVASALKVIEDSGRQSLHDLRQVLNALRSHESIAEATTVHGEIARPQSLLDTALVDAAPGGGGSFSGAHSRYPLGSLGNLDDLVVGVEESGLRVSLTQTGERDRVSNGVQLVVYRIVQESLTNVVRHANASKVDVRVTIAPGEVEVEVLDDGSGPTNRQSRRGGYGLRGMAERVELYGGLLETGIAVGSGFRVFASIPLVDLNAELRESLPENSGEDKS